MHDAFATVSLDQFHVLRAETDLEPPAPTRHLEAQFVWTLSSHQDWDTLGKDVVIGQDPRFLRLSKDTIKIISLLEGLFKMPFS